LNLAKSVKLTLVTFPFTQLILLMIAVLGSVLPLLLRGLKKTASLPSLGEISKGMISLLGSLLLVLLLAGVGSVELMLNLSSNFTVPLGPSPKI